jgi:AcrR family transcriptional regulator
MVMSTSSAKPPRPRRKYDNRRRRADAEARQRRIVDAAVALFIEQGFGATSIDQIAATADVSPQSIYATYGSKAGVLSRAIEVALVGDQDGIPVVDRAPGLADMSAAVCVARFAAYAKFIRALNERVAPLIRVMEQAASSDPALGELRSGLRATQQADCRHWIDQLGPEALRPGLSAAHAVYVMSMIDSPYVYSLLTIDGALTPDDYEQWLAHALPHLLLKPQLLSD